MRVPADAGIVPEVVSSSSESRPRGVCVLYMCVVLCVVAENLHPPPQSSIQGGGERFLVPIRSDRRGWKLDAAGEEEEEAKEPAATLEGRSKAVAKKWKKIAVSLENVVNRERILFWWFSRLLLLASRRRSSLALVPERGLRCWLLSEREEGIWRR